VRDPHVRGRSGYLSISGYGLIGDCRSAALVGIDGSIDWLCLQRFDDESVFSRILDATKGGYWQIAPDTPYRVQRRYRDRANLLDTTFSTGTGVVLLTDFMPVDEHHIEGQERAHDEPRIIRIVECLAGRMRLRQTFDPRPDYAMQVPEYDGGEHHVHADVEQLRLCLVSTGTFDGANSTFTLIAGEAVAFALRAGRTMRCSHHTWTPEKAREYARGTEEYWRRWVRRSRYDGPFQEAVSRSALALKLMTYAPTGAIIAAPTTSLPERIGADRNWDYRFTWLRDASFTLFALFQLGFQDEAHAFFGWLTKRHLGRQGRDIPNLFDLSGHAHIDERELDHLEGYRGSSPVRVGNAAVNQLQLDVYGEVLDSAYLYARFGGEIGKELWQELTAIVDLAIARWQEPDESIWEVRGGRRHFTYSKLMCWVAVDRGLRIAERFHLPHDEAKWKSVRLAIHRRITTEGFSRRSAAFTQYLGGEVLDASVLRISQIRFLEDHDPRLISTVRAIENRLAMGVLVRRYLPEETDDGLSGGEGAFFMCSFWLVDSLAHLGELESAQRRFQRLLNFGSNLGLFSEEVDLRTGELLGNYPQAFTHLALIGAAVNIERARHRHIGARGFSG